jgi:uncharacterized protein DUF1629
MLAPIPVGFHVLASDRHGPHDTEALFGEGFNTGDTRCCVKCGESIGMREWLPPYRVEITLYGKEGAGDFETCPGDSMLVSERLAAAIRTEGVTGLHGFQPVEVVKMNARAKRLGLPKYLRVEATHGRAAVDEVRSRLRRVKPITCEECRSTDVAGIYGFRIQPGTWEGLDVFCPRGLQSEVVVSERFADFVQRHGFTNIKLVPTEELVWDPYRKGPPAQTAQA